MRARPISASKIRPDTSRRRTLLIVCVLIVWMVGIAARLVYLQIVQHERMQRYAQQQHEDTIEISPIRGLLLDREGRELARSVETESCFAVPYEIKDTEATARRLAPLVGVEAKELAARFASAQQGDKKFIWLARRLDEDRAQEIAALKLDGVHMRKEPKRFYPNGSLAAHVLGFVGLDEVGLAGIEQFHDKQIRGEAGKIFIETDAHQHPYESVIEQPSIGQSVVLTIDQMVQYRAEQSLAAAVERTGAKSGTAIVLDPHTGEILALANAPTFDPNNAGASGAQARINQGLQNIYEPGSTFKIVAYSAAIEEGLAKPDDHIDCQMGSIMVAGRLVHDHHPFGSLTLTDALAKSSNVAAIKLGLRVGDERMYDYMKRYGFGSRTGIELPGETAGILRPVARWQPSSMGSLAMGQEVGVTPLQMAAAFGALANAGVRIAPHIVREIRAADGSSVYQAQPEERRVVSPETASALRHMLEGVTLNGTAKKAQLDGYTAAGKTGTAQKIDPKTKTYSASKFIGSFVGFAPVENPAVVIIVVIDEPAGAYHGGDVAAPVFREIAEQILPGLNVTPDTLMKDGPAPALVAQDNGSTEAAERARAEMARLNEECQATLPRVARANEKSGGEVVYALASNRAVLMPDLRGRSVRDAARICAQLGLQLEAHGEGRALKQSPAAGSELDTGQLVQVQFGRSE
ncbi:MAG: transpeptidase family protein [Acidobacteria bacterium]|nr:transpeptidase family protein [Acidobacteriota bacterium]